MNVEKHESSLLEVFSDVGSTPTASTIFKSFIINNIKYKFANRVKLEWPQQIER